MLRVLVSVLAMAPAVGGMQVVGLGPGRTGTDSLKKALEILGFGPCYHMSEVLIELSGISTEGHLELWRDAALRAGGALPHNEGKDLVEALREWNSGVDFPFAMFPDEMLEAFPEAKFVLTVRHGEAWYKSISNTICNHGVAQLQSYFSPLLPFKPFNRMKMLPEAMDAIVRHRFSPSHQTWHSFCEDKAGAIAAYDAWNARVKSLIPPEKLLVFEVGKHGFPELAHFLGKPEPTVPPKGDDNGPQVKMPYPHTNSTNHFQACFGILWGVAILMSGLFLLIVQKLVKTLKGFVRQTSTGVKQKLK